MKKTNNKGFTLVELIVVLVILAILAAILVPALLGYIDKAREKQITTNAEAAYVAAQALATEAYGKGAAASTITNTGYVTKTKIDTLTDIQADYSFNFTVINSSGTGHDPYIIDTFTYTENGKTAFWTRRAGGTVKFGESTDSFTPTAGGWVVGEGTVNYTAPTGN